MAFKTIQNKLYTFQMQGLAFYDLGSPTNVYLVFLEEYHQLQQFESHLFVTETQSREKEQNCVKYSLMIIFV